MTLFACLAVVVLGGTLTAGASVAHATTYLPVIKVATPTCGSQEFPFSTPTTSSWAFPDWVIPGVDVDVYSNGPTYEGTDTDCEDPGGTPENHVDGIRTGEEWQCVEFVNRLYLSRGWISGGSSSAAPWPGSAGPTFYNDAPSNLTKEKDGLVPYLGPGDVVIINVFDNGSPDGGHALVVNDTSDVTTGTVNLVSQNSGYKTNSEPVVSGKISGGFVTVGGGGNGWTYTTYGVVHAPAPTPPPVGTLSVVAKGIGIPFWLAADAHGNLFISEGGAYVVELTPAGKLSVVAGDGQSETAPTPGPATRSSVDGVGIAVDSKGNLFIADNFQDVVFEVTHAGILSIVAGVFGKPGPPKPGPATSSTLNGPCAVAVDAHGNLFIADEKNGDVEKVTPAGMLSVVAGIGRPGLTKPGPATRSGMFPLGVAVNANGDLFVADYGNNVVDEVTPGGDLSVVAGVSGKEGREVPGPATSSDLGTVAGVAVDRKGDLFIADAGDYVVEEVNRAGELSVVAGDGKSGRPRPGLATKSGLGGLNGVAVDAQGDLFIADMGTTPYGPGSVEKVTF
jgi:hypothetical protein